MSYNAWTHEFSCCGLADITVPGRVATRTLVKHVKWQLVPVTCCYGSLSYEAWSAYCIG